MAQFCNVVMMLVMSVWVCAHHMVMLHGDSVEGLAQRVHLARHAGVVHDHLHRHRGPLP